MSRDHWGADKENGPSRRCGEKASLQQTGQDKSTAPTAKANVEGADVIENSGPACALAVATPERSDLGCPPTTNAIGTQNQGNKSSEAEKLQHRYNQSNIERAGS